MAQTLDQQRAAFAWSAACKGVEKHAKDYSTLAKGAPALIMNSGLMPTLAFYQHKSDASKVLEKNIRDWMAKRFEKRPGPERFDGGDVMKWLSECSSALYMEATDEALEILKWIRQFVDAVPKGGNAHG